MYRFQSCGARVSGPPTSWKARVNRPAAPASGASGSIAHFM